MGGTAYAIGGGILSLAASPRQLFAQGLSQDVVNMLGPCGAGQVGESKIPFICFDLAGGANILGSNVLAGKEGGQLDFLSTAGYEKMGLPGDMVPGLVDPVLGDYANFDLGLGFHLDSAFRRGILDSMRGSGSEQFVNGAVIPARSDNDTGNNPHNPTYGIAKLGANGNILTLAGTENSDSGGNSMVPQMLYDPELRPTKVDRPSDVVNLVDTGDLVNVLSKNDATAVMESIYRLTDYKMDRVSTSLPGIDPETGRTYDDLAEELYSCGYVKAASIADEFGGVPIDPSIDPEIVGPNGVFTEQEFNAGDNSAREFQKTASIMKLVVNGYAGAGTIEMGGYDYHGGRRAEGEVKDFRAGRCIGACLEYAAKRGKPLMVYVFSDGSLSSNGAIDNSPEGRGKGEWTSDNSSTAGSFFLVYNPPENGGRPTLLGGTPEEMAQHQQLGYMDSGGSVERTATPAANNVNLLVNTLLLNYMALHGQVGLFTEIIPNHGLGNSDMLDRLTAFEPIVTGEV
jgi:hypothetical protein